MAFDTTILGSSAAVTAHGRFLSAQVVNIEETLHLVDCGEGTQFQLAKYGIRSARLQNIFISHLHGDHYYGLIGLLTSLSLKGREQELRIFAPPILAEIIAIHLRASGSSLNYSIDFQPIDTSAYALVYEDSQIEVHTIPMQHKIGCVGFLFKEKPKQRRIVGTLLPQGIAPTQIEALKQGLNIELNNQVYTSEALTLPPKPQRIYACCADTRYSEAIVPYIEGADFLYHEATYMADQSEKAIQYFHSTTAQAATIAKMSGAKNLIISHFSARYGSLLPLLEEARAIFPQTHLAIEGRRYGLHWRNEQYEMGIEQCDIQQEY